MKHLILTTAAALLACTPALAANSYSGNAKTTVVLDTTHNIADQVIAWPSGKPANATVLEIDIPPGGETGWHQHPVPLIGYIAAGTLTIHFKDGSKKAFRTGEAFAEAQNIVHSGHNEGKEPVRIIAFIAGEKGVNYTEKK